MDYYSKYLKYKTKYYKLKNQVGGNTKYPLINYAPDYTAEVRDYLHRPSAVANNFNKMIQIYKKNNSVPFKNNYYVNFIDVYNNYDKIVTYFTDEQLVDFECILENNRITSNYLESIIPSNTSEFKRLIYVTDLYGKVYVIDKTNTNNTQINHTSLSKGKLVSSAGWIIINNDYNIVEISNLTGHYQSPDISIFNFIKILLEHNFNIENIGVEITRFEGGKLKDPFCVNALDWYRENVNQLTNISISIVDEINYKTSTNIYNLQIKADLINVHFEDDLHVSYLIFQKNDDMYNFITNNNLNDIFNIENTQYPDYLNFINSNKKYIIDNQIDIIEINGLVSKKNVIIFITSYDKLQDYFSPKTIIRPSRKNKYILNYLKNNSQSNVYLLNKQIVDNIFISDEYLLLNIEENILLGNIGLDLLKDSYKIVYSLGDYWDKFIQVFTKNIIQFIIFEKSKCDADANVLNDSINLNKIYTEYKKLFCQDVHDINFVGSSLWKRNLTSSTGTNSSSSVSGVVQGQFVKFFNEKNPTDKLISINTMQDHLLINNIILVSEKLVMEYFTSAMIKQTCHTDTTQFEQVSIVLFRRRLYINKKEYGVTNIINDNVEKIRLSYRNKNLKVKGRKLSLNNIYKYTDDDNICIDLIPEQNLIYSHPCVDISRIICDIFLKSNLEEVSFNEAKGVITHNYETNAEQNILLKIIIHGILVPLLNSEQDKQNIKDWDGILRSSIFLELLKSRSGKSPKVQKVIEVIGVQVLNNINEYQPGIEIFSTHFNKLINEAKYILQI